MNSRITLKINGQEVTVEKGTRVIEAAKQAGAEIPSFLLSPEIKTGCQLPHVSRRN